MPVINGYQNISLNTLHYNVEKIAVYIYLTKNTAIPKGTKLWPVCFITDVWYRRDRGAWPQQFFHDGPYTLYNQLNSSLLTKSSRRAKRIQYIKTNHMIEVNEILKKTIKQTIKTVIVSYIQFYAES